jgi:acyl dehydratase
MADIYFEDLNIGDRQTLATYEVTRDEVIAFAQKYDFQPFHLSDEAAAQTFFGRLSASGWHTASMVMAMLLEGASADPERREHKQGAIGVDELRWVKPVYPGDTLSGHNEVIEKIESKSRPHLGIVKCKITVVNQHGDVVMTSRPIVMWERRPG